MNAASQKLPVLGVVGLGSMGLGAATSGVRSGLEVWGFDMRQEAMDQLKASGGHAAASLSDLGARCSVVLVLVVNATQVEHVLFGPDGLAHTLRPGSVVVASATVAPSEPPKWEDRLAKRGIHLIDAPVSGGARRAQDGAMTMMTSGTPQAYAAADSVLACIAGKVFRLGDRPGIGSTVKMINQHLAGIHIAAACEAMTLGMRAGADAHQLYEVICESAGMSWMFHDRVPHILDGNYSPRSAVNIFVKDLGIVLDGAASLTFPAPMAAAARQLFVAASALGHGLEDDAAVAKVYAALAGLELPGPSQGRPAP